MPGAGQQRERIYFFLLVFRFLLSRKNAHAQVGDSVHIYEYKYNGSSGNSGCDSVL